MSAIGSGQGVNFFLIQTLSEVDSGEGGGGGRVTLILNTGFIHIIRVYEWSVVAHWLFTL